MSVRMGEGSPTSRIMIVGEAWGESEERTGVPFSGNSGEELNRMLQEAGIMRNECYVTNVINARPFRNDITKWIPESKAGVLPGMVQRLGKFVAPIVAEGLAMLEKEIELVAPQVIVALGGTALWALTGNTSIVKWRGSLLRSNQHRKLSANYKESRDVAGLRSLGSEVASGDRQSVGGIRVVPTYHPAAVLRMWEWRAVAVLDLKRAAKELSSLTETPKWNFTIRPTFDSVVATLNDLQSKVALAPTWIDLDLETKSGHIACCGLSWSRLDAICIPFMEETDRNGYWLEEEEAHILHLLYKLLTNPNCLVRGQNILYDVQYTYRRWHFIPNVRQDTMIAHHVLWPGLPKSLAFQASMYSEYYVNWKPDKEQWKEGG